MGKLFVTGLVGTDYNDEYTTVVDGGGINPDRAFTSEADAKEYCIEKILEEINRDPQGTAQVGYDATFDERWEWHFRTKPERCELHGEDEDECSECEDNDHYIEPECLHEEVFDFKALIAWAERTDADLWNYLPRVWDFVAVEVGR